MDDTSKEYAVETRAALAKETIMRREEDKYHLEDLFDISETKDAFESPLVPLPEKDGGGVEDEEEFSFPFIPSPKRVDGIALDKLGLQSLYLDAETPQRDAFGRAAERQYRQEADARIEGVRARLQATKQTQRSERDRFRRIKDTTAEEIKTPCTDTKLAPPRVETASAERHQPISKIATPAVLKERNVSTPASMNSHSKKSAPPVATSDPSPKAENHADIYSGEYLERLMQQEEEAFKCKSGVQNSPEGGPRSEPEKRPTAEERHHNLWSQV